MSHGSCIQKTTVFFSLYGPETTTVAEKATFGQARHPV